MRLQQIGLVGSSPRLGNTTGLLVSAPRRQFSSEVEPTEDKAVAEDQTVAKDAQPATESIFDGRSLSIPAEKLLELVDQTQVTQEFKENYLQLDSLEKIERLVNFNEDKLNGTQYLLLLRSLIATWHDLISVRPDEHGYSEARDQIKLFNSKI